VVEETILAHQPREEPMNIATDTYPATAPAPVATVPPHRWRTTFVALGLATLLGIGAGVGAAALLDDDSGPVAHPSTAAAATATNTTDADTLWSYLAQLPTAERDQALASLTHDPSGALRAVIAGELAKAG
jgi:hypothetical protein